jgi:hypothetical protein
MISKAKGTPVEKTVTPKIVFTKPKLQRAGAGNIKTGTKKSVMLKSIK